LFFVLCDILEKIEGTIIHIVSQVLHKKIEVHFDFIAVIIFSHFELTTSKPAREIIITPKLFVLPAICAT